jgi:ElaB/YqjD/DUF883 family membrane-anchored ribosome-binding protein
MLRSGGLDGSANWRIAAMAETHGDITSAQIAYLRDQVETLMRDRVTPAVSNIAGRAEAAVHSAGGSVQEHPLAAILAAAAVGYIAGRLTR